MKRRTKIIATLGPTSENIDVLERVIEAGADAVRLNFSHGTAEEHYQNAENIRKCAQKIVGCEIGILVDLQGPKIRIAKFCTGKVLLKAGDTFVLDAELDRNAGTPFQVGIDYKELPRDVHPGDILLLNDGLLKLRVEKVKGPRITCCVIIGGELSDKKGINRLGGGLSACALTEKDKSDLKRAVEIGADFVCLSFPRDANDVLQTKQIIKKAGGDCGVIAKIERAEAVKHIDDIICASDGVMVARGDLAVEIGEAEVPGVQKRIIRRAHELYKPVITATQMMESMITQSSPTRAEVSDVANAVLDQTDAVMLSAETAVGAYPVRVVEIAARICESAEKFSDLRPISADEIDFKRIDEAIAITTMYTANHMHPKAIIALTETGSTPLLMSRIRSDIPIYALSRIARSRGKMTIYRDVFPIPFDFTKIPVSKVDQRVVNELAKRKLVAEDDLVILTRGESLGKTGGTNAMKIITVKE